MAITIDTRTRNAGSVLFLFLVVFLAYSQTITFDWVHYDDDAYVLNNPMIGLPAVEAIGRMFSAGYFFSYTPLTLASHMLDLKLWGTEPAGHHLTNVVLHGLNAVWVMVLVLVIAAGVKRQGGNGSVAAVVRAASGDELLTSLLAALLFALHPLRAESVAWISDRKDLLACAFLLPSAILYMHARLSSSDGVGSPRMVFSVLLFALAALSKTSSIALSGVLLLMELALIGRRKRWADRLRGAFCTVPFFLVGLAVGVMAVLAAPKGAVGFRTDEFSTAVRWMLPEYSMLFYIGKILCPFPLVPVYLAPSAAIVAVGAVGFVLGAIVLGNAYARGHETLPIACASYVIMILPTVVGLGAGIQPWADRYSYAASIPLFIVTAFGLAFLIEKGKSVGTRLGRWLVTTFILCLLGALSVLTFLQARTWHDAMSLWSHQFITGERPMVVYNNLGLAYYALGERQKARELFEEAVRLEPRYLEGLLNLGMATKEREELLHLCGVYKESLRFNPGSARLHHALGETYKGLGCMDSAVTEYRRAADLDPDLGTTFVSLGLWHLQQGRNDSAKACFQHAVAKTPGSAPPYYYLGMLALAEGDSIGAVRMLTTAARLGSPGAKQALKGLNRLW